MLFIFILKVTFSKLFLLTFLVSIYQEELNLFSLNFKGHMEFYLCMHMCSPKHNHKQMESMHVFVYLCV